MALSKPRPILQDMPLHIKENITKSLDSNFDKMILRNAHPDFRRVIGNPRFEHSHVELMFYDRKRSMVKLNVRNNDEGHWIEYIPVKDGTEIRRTSRTISVGNFKTETFLPAKHGNFIDLMVEAFACLVDNPNLEIGWFIICADPMPPSMAFDELHWQEFLSKIEQVLRNLKHKVKTKNLKIECLGKQKNLLKILPYFDPKRLHIKSLKEDELDGVDKLINHWKHVDELIMFDLPDNKFPIEQWWDFPRTIMRVRHTSLEDIKRLVQHFRRSSTFVECILDTKFQPKELLKVLDESRSFQIANRSGGGIVELPATETMNKVLVVVNGEGYVNILRSSPTTLTIS